MPTEHISGDDDSTSQTQRDLANGQQPAKVAPKRDPVLSARDELLARMDEQITAERAQMDEDAIASGDEATAAVKARMEQEATGRQVRTDSRQGRQVAVEPDPGDQDGYSGTDPDEAAEAAEAQQLADDEVTQAARQITQPDTRGRDPLADFIVREPGKPPMFRAVVDGEVKLIPLDQARVTLQKHVAADIRIQRAGIREQALNAREAALRAAEQQRTARPVATPIDDAALDLESQNLVKSLLNEPEAKAAVTVKGVLKKILASVPQIDTQTLIRQAADVAKREIVAENTSKALATGLTQFETNYQDIVSDPDLYNLADNRTNDIAAAHPEWTPAQVMAEAGEQVREWVGKLSGKPYARPRGQQPRIQLVGQSNRQLAKGNLKPMPQPRSARPARGQDPNAADTPQDAVNEIRRARGQVS